MPPMSAVVYRCTRKFPPRRKKAESLPARKDPADKPAIREKAPAPAVKKRAAKPAVREKKAPPAVREQAAGQDSDGQARGAEALACPGRQAGEGLLNPAPREWEERSPHFNQEVIE